MEIYHREHVKPAEAAGQPAPECCRRLGGSRASEVGALRMLWLGLGGLAWTFGGYHLVMSLLARRRNGGLGAPVGAAEAPLPPVSVVIALHNEQQRVAARVQNLLGDSDYPAELLEVVLVDDGSTDDTAEAVRTLAAQYPGQVRLVQADTRRGKAECLNLGVEIAEGEVVVFADARQRFAPDAIGRLAGAFVRPEVGAISGNLEIAPSGDGGTAGGVDVYWRLEKHLRAAESRVDSAVGCTGAIYAIRRQLYRPLPPDTLLDDVVIPLQIAEQGYRVLFDEKAVAWDPQELDPDLEKRRKRRTLAGNFQMLLRYPHWLLPPPVGHRLWWQVISHKYLRLAGPAFLVLTLLGSLRRALTGRSGPGKSLAILALLGQGGLYGLAIAGMRRKTGGQGTGGKPGKWLGIPAGFLFLNLQVLEGLRYYLRNRGKGTW